jgi:hypothetical protein
MPIPRSAWSATPKALKRICRRPLLTASRDRRRKSNRSFRPSLTDAFKVTLDAEGNLTVNNTLCEGIDSAALPATCPRLILTVSTVAAAPAARTAL